MKRIILMLVVMMSWPFTVNSFQKVQAIELSRAIDVPDQYEKDVADMADKFEKAVEKELRKEFPCPDLYISNPKIVSDWCSVGKKMEILGGNVSTAPITAENLILKTRLEVDLKKINGEHIKDLGGMLDQLYMLGNPRFLVVSMISVKETGKKARVNFYVRLADTKPKIYTQPILYEGSCEGDLTGDVPAKCKTLAKELTKMLAYAEPCPYRGKVIVNGNWERKQEPLNEERMVSCDGVERKYSRTRKVIGSGDEKWDLERNWNPYSQGQLIGKGITTTTDTEDDGCPSCREEGCQTCERHWEKKTTENLDLAGLTKFLENIRPESQRDLIQADWDVDDVARTELRFLKNGTYTISVKAIVHFKPDDNDKFGARTLTTEVATGSCDTFPLRENPEKKHFPGVIDKTWGPFPGTPFDHILKGKKTLPINHPEIGEKATKTLEFKLERMGGK